MGVYNKFQVSLAQGKSIILLILGSWFESKMRLS